LFFRNHATQFLKAKTFKASKIGFIVGTLDPKDSVPTLYSLF